MAFLKLMVRSVLKGLDEVGEAETATVSSSSSSSSLGVTTLFFECFGLLNI